MNKNKLRENFIRLIYKQVFYTFMVKVPNLTQEEFQIQSEKYFKQLIKDAAPDKE